REKVLRVEVSKAKSRWVPFEETLAKELSDYLRGRCLIRPASEDSRFLVQPNGSPLGRTIASSRITVLLRQAGMKPGRGRVGPRPYDTRHSFAVNRLTNWYREGVDVQERLAWLSAYLGHDDLLGTQDYLQLTPELRRIVSTAGGLHPPLLGFGGSMSNMSNQTGLSASRRDRLLQHVEAFFREN